MRDSIFAQLPKALEAAGEMFAASQTIKNLERILDAARAAGIKFREDRLVKEET